MDARRHCSILRVIQDHEAVQEDSLHPGILLNYMSSRPIVAVLSIIPHLPADIPIVGWIVFIVWAATKGTVGPNRFGPEPLITPNA